MKEEGQRGAFALIAEAVTEAMDEIVRKPARFLVLVAGVLVLMAVVAFSGVSGRDASSREELKVEIDGVKEEIVRIKEPAVLEIESLREENASLRAQVGRDAMEKAEK
jgi:hypothetical protein